MSRISREKINFFLILLIVNIILFSNCTKRDNSEKYSIKNAPSSNYAIADYEIIFTVQEYGNLSKIINSIKKKYNTQVYILTVVSFSGMVDNTDYLEKRWNDIFSLNSNISNSRIIFLFSHNEKHYSEIINPEFRKKINEDSFGRSINIIISKYFKQHQYYQAFKEILEALEKELQKKTA